MNELFGPPTAAEMFLWRRALVALLLAFGLGQAVAAAYVAVFRGLSYSRAMVRGMAMASIVTCLVMLAVGNSIAAGIGVAAGLTAVRFRTSLRDPQDIVFIFASLATGMACGVHAYGVAVAGAAVFVAGAGLLQVSGFGVRRQPDGLLRFVAPPGAEEQVARVLRGHCRLFSLVTLREAAQGTMFEHAYQISTYSPDLQGALVAGLKAVPGVQDVALLLQEPTLDL